MRGIYPKRTLRHIKTQEGNGYYFFSLSSQVVAAFCLLLKNFEALSVNCVPSLPLESISSKFISSSLSILFSTPPLLLDFHLF